MATIDFDSLMRACESQDYIGFCVNCGAEHYGVEPDASYYECDDCGERTVFGAQELLIRCIG
jgi:DNA-directed RNA polymerase subunit RPC12/RpoP